MKGKVERENFRELFCQTPTIFLKTVHTLVNLQRNATLNVNLQCQYEEMPQKETHYHYKSL